MDTVLHRWLRLPYFLHGMLRKGDTTRPTVVFLHGIGNSGLAWNETIKGIDPSLRTLQVDLLGFGASRKPSKATYNADIQARSVRATLRRFGIRGPIIMVGHSLGSLVAIEYAQRYKKSLKGLILCSPPLYVKDETSKRRLIPRADKYLQSLYESVIRSPEQFIKLSAFAMKYRLINASFNVTADNIESYMATLQSTIINQSAYEHLSMLDLPVTILRGRLDPLVVYANLRSLKTLNPHITLRSVTAAHEVRGLFATAVQKAIENMV